MQLFNILELELENGKQLKHISVHGLKELHFKLLFKLQAKLADFFHGPAFYLKEQQKIMVIQTWMFDSYFLENEQSEHVTSRKTTGNTCCQ